MNIELERILVIDGISSLIPNVKNKLFIRYFIQKYIQSLKIHYIFYSKHSQHSTSLLLILLI